MDLFVRQYFQITDSSESRTEDEPSDNSGATFSNKEPIPRQVDELPWQWQEAAEWQSAFSRVTE